MIVPCSLDYYLTTRLCIKVTRLGEVDRLSCHTINLGGGHYGNRTYPSTLRRHLLSGCGVNLVVPVRRTGQGETLIGKPMGEKINSPARLTKSNVEGRFFEKPAEQQRTLTELLDRYIKERTAGELLSGVDERENS